MNDAKELRMPFFTVLFILIGIFLYTKLAGPIPFLVNTTTTTKTNLFHVEGTGKATEVPDTALISIGVTKTAFNVLDVQKETNAAVNKIIDDLKKLGIEEKNIKTTNYSVSPNYDYTTGRQTITGYTVSQNLEVKIKPIDKANKAIDAVTADGANIVGGISFVLNDETQKRLQNKARAEAIKNAKEKAESLSKLSGIRLGKIIDIQEGVAFEPHPVLRTLQEGEAKEEQTKLSPGENTVTSVITLSYETY